MKMKCGLCKGDIHGNEEYVVDHYKCSADLSTSFHDDIHKLEVELAQWRTCGVIEIAVRNVNVKSYMDHWEGRATKAEAERDKLRAALAGLLGASTREELEQLEMGMRLMPAPAEDKAVSIDAIHALLAVV
jgi:hypothetical protein